MINTIGTILELFSVSVFGIVTFTAVSLFAIAGFKVLVSLLRE